MPISVRGRWSAAGMLLVAITASTAAAQRGPAITTVVLVRHAEKVDASRDPELSQAGRERAAALARALADVPFDAVLSTPFIRTRETARPVATQAGVPITETPVTEAYAGDLAARLRDEYAGLTVLIVGHSNTTPDVIRALGVRPVPAIADHKYDDIFVVTLLPDGAARALHLHYGRATP